MRKRYELAFCEGDQYLHQYLMRFSGKSDAFDELIDAFSCKRRGEERMRKAHSIRAQLLFIEQVDLIEYLDARYLICIDLSKNLIYRIYLLFEIRVRSINDMKDEIRSTDLIER